MLSISIYCTDSGPSFSWPFTSNQPGTRLHSGEKISQPSQLSGSLERVKGPLSAPSPFLAVSPIFSPTSNQLCFQGQLILAMSDIILLYWSIKSQGIVILKALCFFLLFFFDWYRNLLMIAVFYALPVVQLVITYQKVFTFEIKLK